MSKIKLQDLIKILDNDVVKYNSCIEMNFCIDNDTVYDDCWLGKMPDRDNSRKAAYWYGLVPDGSQAYEYTELEDFIDAKVFSGKSMRDVIEKVTWYSLDGCSIEERLPNYLDENEEDNYLAVGMCMDMCLGMIVGNLLFKNTGIGMSIGTCLGLAIGSSIKQKK